MGQRVKRILDALIQLFIITGFLYAGYQLFFVFGNPEGNFILFGDAAKIDIELLVARRLYAMEFWLIFIGYLVYLGLRKRIWDFNIQGAKRD